MFVVCIPTSLEQMRVCLWIIMLPTIMLCKGKPMGKKGKVTMGAANGRRVPTSVKKTKAAMRRKAVAEVAKQRRPKKGGRSRYRLLSANDVKGAILANGVVASTRTVQRDLAPRRCVVRVARFQAAAKQRRKLNRAWAVAAARTWLE